MNYIFVHTEQIEIKSIQERFFEIFYDQDADLDHVTKFHKACQQFINEYKLKPPYANYSSFKTSMSNRMKGKQR